MKKLSNTESEFKKAFLFKKACNFKKLETTEAIGSMNPK